MGIFLGGGWWKCSQISTDGCKTLWQY
jgi:hypothetical protein